MNTLLVSHPRDELVVAHHHGDRLRAEAAAERLCGRSGTRRVLAASLRRVAELLDPAPLGPSPVLRSPSGS